MRKTINILAATFFLWLVINTFISTSSIYTIAVNFLLAGAIPGSSMSLSPTMMLAIMTALGGIIVFELLARRFDMLLRFRHYLTGAIKKYERLPKRRFHRA